MKRFLSPGRSIIAVLIVVSGTSTVSAGWENFWHSLHIGYHRNNAWPAPFNEADAMQVVSPFAIQVRNGWRVNNTIGHELFRQGDGALLAAGHKQVEWIATQSPATRRQIFVLGARNEQETEARLESVREALAAIRSSGPEPEIYVTERIPATADGVWGADINRAMHQFRTAPRLPQTSASGQSSVGTSGGGGAGAGR